MKIQHHQSKSKKRALRVRSKLVGVAQRPRLSVYRSNQHIYAQAIDDQRQLTLVAVNDKQLKLKTKLTKTEKAHQVGERLADKLKAAKIAKVIFDRGPYRYHGRVKAIAEALRQQGIKL